MNELNYKFDKLTIRNSQITSKLLDYLLVYAGKFETIQKFSSIFVFEVMFQKFLCLTGLC